MKSTSHMVHAEVKSSIFLDMLIAIYWCISRRDGTKKLQLLILPEIRMFMAFCFRP
jgi:hypothetical protein